MFKPFGITLAIICLAGCATQSKAPPLTVDSEALKTLWEMEGRGPEWHISINGERFHGSFPGRYEGRIMGWSVTEKGNKTTLVSDNKQASIVLKEEACTVAGKEFTHTATAKINQQTYRGCAKHKSL
ncbi:hypothetical protein [Wohlfahrtiimonas chitiniclastica]|uniref:hypothetical protein n=1 Tax=Wohlfahrtiimonas chitiniclastica TaxID=400946 RepID=UPI000B997C57|nr:hypothetical protein [Wohlfahrtiimonas chitiniclastica]MBS7837497.1 hypothetical protein [Wohlfahrtiimonas chitiniclastica]OYQ76214.1 hypothetical protein B9T18_02315 [Wohlfahrtiimonas chitiniclastica]